MVDNMAPINSQITENDIIQKVLQVQKKATKEFVQEYTNVSFDLVVAKKAYSLLWQPPPPEYSDVIVQIGIFHTVSSYLAAFSKQTVGSGLEEIVIESGACASGSLTNIVSGKHYDRAMRVHKLALEPFKILLFESLWGP